jgi:hypothetical protein
MKRGRPAMRAQYRREILDVLASYQYPATTSTVKRMLDTRRLHPCGWDTVEKYLQELAAEGLVIRQSLPTERRHKPLIIYMPARRSDGGFLGTFSRD